MNTVTKLFALPMALAALGLGANALAQGIELDESELFLELNDTDGDLGIHTSIDGGPYEELEISDAAGRTAFAVEARGRAGRHGLTQLFLESAEPSFDDLPPEEFFARFPEGVYTIEIEWGEEEAEEEVELSHVMPAPASNVTVNGTPAAEDCDGDLPVVASPVTIDWDPVTTSHPEIGKEGEVEIEVYQLFVEEGGEVGFQVDLPADMTEFEVPEAVTQWPGTYKFEILARSTAFNNTAVESCFIVE